MSYPSDELKFCSVADTRLCARLFTGLDRENQGRTLIHSGVYEHHMGVCEKGYTPKQWFFAWGKLGLSIKFATSFQTNPHEQLTQHRFRRTDIFTSSLSKGNKAIGNNHGNSIDCSGNDCNLQKGGKIIDDYCR